MRSRAASARSRPRRPKLVVTMNTDALTAGDMRRAAALIIHHFRRSLIA
jgi:hypothetical protein